MQLNHEQTLLLRQVLSALRRRLAERSLEAYCRIYLARHFALPPSRMHYEMFDILERITGLERGKCIALAGPRGYAKSTVLMAYVLWGICFKKEHFVLFISNTNSLAITQLSHVKRELETNELLMEDFPDVAEERGKKPAPERWAQDIIITRSEARLSAIGGEASLRGLRHKEHRPTLVVIDDLENEEQVRSSEQREKLRDWVMKAVLKAGDNRTNVIITGTIMHPESLLAEFVDSDKSPGWLGFRYRAIEEWSERADYWRTWENLFARRDDFQDRTGPQAADAFFAVHRNVMLAGTRVLWPEKEGYYELVVRKMRDGETSFYSEMQNEPRSPADCIFQAKQMTFWNAHYGSVSDLLRSFRSRALFFGACDPSLGKQKGDPSAIVTVALDPAEGIVYVVGADIVNRRTNDILTRIRTLHDLWPYTRFIFEDNQFQKILYEELLRMGVATEPLTNSGNKQLRISTLEPFVNSGRIQFDRRHTLLLDQLWLFPTGKHDDGPDALQMAFEAARKAPRVSPEEEAQLIYEANKPQRSLDDPSDFRWAVGDYDGRPIDDAFSDRNFPRPRWW